MDMKVISPTSLASRPRDMVKCCNCGCGDCCLVASSSQGSSWFRSVKRKFDEFEEGNGLVLTSFDLLSNPRVQIENECAALRETVSSQQQSIQDLQSELEEERNASSSAANEAMSMILRLQSEKAEIQMELRQFKRFADEKMAHDQQELLAFEDILYKREQAIQSLTCEVQAYKHRMLSYGLTEAEVEGELGETGGFSRNPSMSDNMDAGQYEFPFYNYPPLKCNLNENPSALETEDVEDDVVDVEKYAFGETPRAGDHLRNLEFRINEMENSPRSPQLDGEPSSARSILEKVIVGHSPRRPRQNSFFSWDSSNSFSRMPREATPDIASESARCKFNNSTKKMDSVSLSNLRKVDNASDFGDNASDRVYTIDSVHNGAPCNGISEPGSGIGTSDDYNSAPRNILDQPDDPDIKKLYTRLQALEADRESMRQVITSMQTDKAQMALLKEIAQHLCKEMTPEKRMPVKKPSIVRTFSFMSVFKWIVSFVFWRKKARQSRYTCGLSATNVGLLLLLDKGSRMRKWRCLASTQV